MKKNTFLFILLATFFIAFSQEDTIHSTGIYSLDDCKKMALENNVMLKNADLEVQAAEQTKKAAFTKYFPTVSAMGAGFTSNNNFVDVDVSDVDISVEFDNPRINQILQALYSQFGQYLPNVDVNMQMIDKGLVGSITAIQPIFAGGRIVNGNKLAQVGVEAAQYQSSIKQNEILLKTEKSYWQVILLQEKMKTVNMLNIMLDTLYRDVSSYYEAGFITQNDVLKVKLKQNELSSNKLKLENGIKLAKMALCQQIGVPFDENIELTETVDASDDPNNFHTDHHAVLGNRNEAKLLNLNVQAETLKKNMVIGTCLPSVGVGAGLLYNNIMGKDKGNAVLFGTVSVPITAWWEGAHNVKKQQIKQQIAENTQQEVNELLLLQMQQAWDEVEAAYRQIAITEEAIRQSEENVRLSNDYYHAGLNSLSELLEAQTLLQQSHNQYSDATIEYKIKLTYYIQMVQ
ncbi:MAG: TolC family protein [Bacteroidales bacterium]|nr:TolC family protein [Bacteroidales bacterium]